MALPSAALPGVSIVIPAWNEEDRLARTLERCLPALEARGDPFEVIVVVDGVKDRTPEGAARFADRPVRVLRFPTKLEKGGTILAGRRGARYGYGGCVDADGPISPDEMCGLAEVDSLLLPSWMRGASGRGEARNAKVLDW